MSAPIPEAEHRFAASFRRQCLFAVTILLVEDSRSASEAIRLYAAESGARVRRADSIYGDAQMLSDQPGRRGSKRSVDGGSGLGPAITDTQRSNRTG